MAGVGVRVPVMLMLTPCIEVVHAVQVVNVVQSMMKERLCDDWWIG